MVIAFANNQSVSAIDGTDSVITTDPVPFDGYDRATANFNVHYIYTTGGGAPDIAYQAQMSNDGTNWFADADLKDNTGSATTTPRQVVAEAHGAFIRFQFTHKIVGGASGDTASCNFDVHVLLDHT